MKKRVCLLSVCLLLAVATLCGCVSNDDFSWAEQSCRTFLDALIEQDADLAWSVCASDFASREEFDELFYDMVDEARFFEGYELEFREQSLEEIEGEQYTCIKYAIVVDGKTVSTLQVASKEGVTGLVGILFD